MSHVIIGLSPGVCGNDQPRWGGKKIASAGCMVSPGLWGGFLFFSSLPFSFRFPSSLPFLPPPSPGSPRLGLACPGQGPPSARRALSLARWHPWRPQFKNQNQCARWPLRCSSCAVCPWCQWCALSAVRPRCVRPRLGVPSARCALSSALPWPVPPQFKNQDQCAGALWCSSCVRHVLCALGGPLAYVKFLG